MKIVNTFHPSSSVVSSVKCRLASRDVEHLVIAKLDRVDVYSLRPHGLQYECGVDIWGQVLSVKAIPISGTERSKLVLMTNHPDPELVFFSFKENEAGGAELNVNKSVSLYERSPRQAEFFNDFLIHPSGTLAIASCYVGKLKVIKLKAGDYVEDFDFSILELNVLSLAFLPTSQPAIAILHLDYQSRVQLLSREIPESIESEISTLPSTLLQPTSISNQVIPFPADIVPKLLPVPPEDSNLDEGEDAQLLGGIVVLGGRKILLYELASETGQAKQRGKMNRLEKMKSDPDPVKAKQAREKQAERESRKRKPTASVEWPWDEVASWCAVDGDSLRFFVGDIYGGLSLLSLHNVKNSGPILIPLGRTSPPTSLTYLTNQTLFVGSHLGDSKLVYISASPVNSLDESVLSVPPEVKTVPRNSLNPVRSKGKGRAAPDDMDVDTNEVDETLKGRIVAPEGSHLKVLNSFRNIAPINDAIMADIEGGGQNEIITCSGGYSTGSLNVVRNGAEFKEAATVPGIPNINTLWPIKTSFEDSTHSHFIASTHDRSMLFRLNDDGRHTTLSYLDSSASRDFVTNEPTIALSNVRRRTVVNNKTVYKDSQWIIQVTASGVFLLEDDAVMGGYNLRVRWTPPLSADSRPSEIVSASINPSQIAVALDGGRLTILRPNEQGTGFEIVADKHLLREISAVSCQPLDATTPYAKLFTVAYWESGFLGANTGDNEKIVEVFELGKRARLGSADLQLTSVAKIFKKQLPALARSVLLYSFGTPGEPYHPYLLCGLADGSLAHFVWKNGQPDDLKLVSLGSSPVHLSSCQVDGKSCIMAVGNRATVFSYERKRLIHSPITLKDLTAACSLNTTTFPSAFVFSNLQGLTIGSVKELGKLSIRSIPLGYDTPQRIVHIPLLRAFAVTCTTQQRSRIGEIQVLQGSLKLMDDSSFKVISQFNCEQDEAISSLATFTREVEGKDTAFICAGTTSTSKKARLLMFSAISSETTQLNQELSMIASRTANGEAVNSLKVVNGYIIAAIDSAVVSYKLEPREVESLPFRWIQVSEWNHNYIVRSLGSFNNNIVIGDIASSVSLVALNDFGKISPVARDYAPLFPYALEALSENSLIGGNDASNIFTFSLGQGSMNRRILERDGSYFLGDLTTKFIRGSISSDSGANDMFGPEAVFFTSGGKIGVVTNIKDQDLALHLSELQRNLSAEAKGIGALSHASYRAPRNKRSRTDAEVAAFGFIDGDFLETFLSILGDQKKVEKVVAGQSEPERLTFPVEEFQKALETLQSLH